MNNYITKKADLSLWIRIVKSSFMIYAKGQAILVFQKECRLILREPQHTKKLLQVSFGIFNDVLDYIQKCDRCQRQSSLLPNLKSKMHNVPVSSHVMKLVGLDTDICFLREVDGYRHLIVCIDYFTKWSEAKPTRDKTVLTVATFLYELMCRHGCFEVQIND